MNKNHKMNESPIHGSSDKNQESKDMGQELDLILLDEIQCCWNSTKKRFKPTAWTHLFPPFLAKYDRLLSIGITVERVNKEFGKNYRSSVLYKTSKQANNTIPEIVKFMRHVPTENSQQRRFGATQILRFSKAIDSLDYGVSAKLASRVFAKDDKGVITSTDKWVVNSDIDILLGCASDRQKWMREFFNSEGKSGRPSPANTIDEALFVSSTSKTIYELIDKWTYVKDLSGDKNREKRMDFGIIAIAALRHSYDEFQKTTLAKDNFAE